MLSHGSTCPVCHSEYNDAECLPRILPNCGHTICTECLTRSLKDHSFRQCPLDRVEFPHNLNKADAFKINYGLKELLDEASTQEMCTPHKERIRLICHTCKQKICDDCVHFGEHKDHDVQSIKQIQTKLEPQRKEVEGMLSRLDKHSRAANKILSDTKTNMEKLVKDRFAELTYIIQQKEKELTSYVSTFFTQQENQFKNVIQLRSKLKTDLTRKLNYLKDVTRCNDIFSLIAEEPSPLLHNLSQETLDESLQNFTQNVKGFQKTFAERLANLSMSVFTLDFPTQEALNANNGFLSVYDEDIAAKNTPKMEIDTKFKLNFTEDLLEISRNEQTQPVKIVPDDLNKVKRLRIDLWEGIESEQSMLPSIFKHIGDIDSLELFSSDKRASLSESYSVMLFLMMKMNSLKSLKIDFSGCYRINDSVDTFLENLLGRSAELKNLDLNLSQTGFSDIGIPGLSKTLIPLLKNIEHLNLGFQETRVSDDGISSLFVALPKVESFCLNVMKTNISDDALESFATNTLPTMEKLRSFALLLSNTKVTDAGCISVFGNLKNIKELALGLNQTRISDVTLEVLSNVMTTFSNELVDLTLLLEKTNVSDSGITQIFGLMENMKDFVLHLNETRITDATIEKFSEISLISMTNLEYLQLGLSSTNITNKSVTQLFANKPPFKRFVLNLNATAVTDEFVASAISVLPTFKSLQGFNMNLLNTRVTREAMLALNQLNQELGKKNQTTA